MPNYIWKGVNSYGQKRKGKMDAPNEATVHAYLKKIRVTPSQVKEAPKDIFENISFLQPGSLHPALEVESVFHRASTPQTLMACFRCKG